MCSFFSISGRYLDRLADACMHLHLCYCRHVPTYGRFKKERSSTGGLARRDGPLDSARTQPLDDTHLQKHRKDAQNTLIPHGVGDNATFCIHGMYKVKMRHVFFHGARECGGFVIMLRSLQVDGVTCQCSEVVGSAPFDRVGGGANDRDAKSAKTAYWMRRGS